MTAFKSGDPVRVKIDVAAVVTFTNFGMGVADVRVAGWDYELLNVPLAALVALPKPLAVGDVVTDAAQLADLPDGSVIACQSASALPAGKRLGSWFVGVNDVVEAKLLASWPGATVLRVGASL